MLPFIFLLVFFQALGALVGAFSAVWSELAYVRMMRDGRIDHAERAHLDYIGHGLRWGMSLLFLASFGLVVVSYLLQAATQPALTAQYWLFIMLGLLVTTASWALSRKQVSFKLGTAVTFTGWWFLVFLTLGQMPPLSFGASIAFFVIATAIFYALLHYARLLMVRGK
ncbi:hypothetical protein A2950_01505 [Candidatus Kaiserbacteria bacterium RIFCSPLOWO2_01_FULL_55_19]|uniref:Uncharacterized protein n=1 Tax=Candidatus Kaiserbacteria bacterium RIFCSPLOWO2_01_FULL_55_19 TaxID=1798516 RepID=A0A1F6ES60_9BACT|nr:MAG: hypothetical protein A2950_01505 [Candidatus Kaiserbacteria bacterium RIFCSPLOWO2_01_FULL_55_19]